MLKIYLESEKKDSEKRWNREIASLVAMRDSCNDKAEKLTLQTKLEDCHRQKMSFMVRVYEGSEPVSGFSFFDIVANRRKIRLTNDDLNRLRQAINAHQEKTHINADCDVSAALISELSSGEWEEFNVLAAKNIVILSGMVLRSALSGEPIVVETDDQPHR